MGYTRLSELSTYHNDKDLVFVVTAHDLLGNVMFEEQKYFYKLGQHVHFTIPQFDDYYIETPDIDFCIDKDTYIELTYKHLISAHIDITNDDDKVVYCGPLDLMTHDLEYFDRADIVRYAQVPCMFEGLEYCFTYPAIDGYYTDDEFIHVIVKPYTILHKKYHKIEPIHVQFVNELGEIINDLIVPIEQDTIKANEFTYIVDDEDFDSENYYFEDEGREINRKFTIKLRGSNNIITVPVIHYRTLHINTTLIDTNNENEIKTICVPDKKYRIGDKISIVKTDESFDDYVRFNNDDNQIEYISENDKFYTDIADTIVTVDKLYEYNEEHDEVVFNVNYIVYKNFIQFDVYYICNYNNDGEYTPSTPFYIEHVTGLKQDITYTYTPEEKAGYATHVKYYYLRANKNQSLHIEFHRVK